MRQESMLRAMSKNYARGQCNDHLHYTGKKMKEALSTPSTPTALQADSATAWAQAHRLALELECLLLDTKDNAIVSKWWDSGMEALSEYQELQPGAAESAEAWAKMRKEMK